MNCLALLPDGRRFVSGSPDKTARIVEHGLALAPTRAYVAAEKEALRLGSRTSIGGTRAGQRTRLKTEMAAVAAMERLM